MRRVVGLEGVKNWEDGENYVMRELKIYALKEILRVLQNSYFIAWLRAADIEGYRGRCRLSVR